MVDFEKDFQNAVKKFNKDVERREILEEQVVKMRKQVKQLAQKEIDSRKALEIIQIVGQKTMANLEFRISNLVTVAMRSVFPFPPEFVARMENRRNQTETDLLFKEFGVEQKPLDSSGFGTVDVAAFALRPTFWTLHPNRPTFILDEPFRNVSPNLQYKVSEMISMISDKLGIQILMVSHAEQINVAADLTYLVTKEGKISSLEEEV